MASVQSCRQNLTQQKDEIVPRNGEKVFWRRDSVQVLEVAELHIVLMSTI